MRNALLITLNILKMIFRKKINIVIYIVIPILTILVSMFIHSASGTENFNIGINDKDNSIISKDIVKSISSVDRFKVSNIDEKDINQMVSSGKVDCVLVFPEGFQNGIYDNKMKTVDIISIKGYESTIWIENHVNFYMDNLSNIMEVSKGDKAVFDKIYDGFKNKDLKLENVKLEDSANSKSVTTTTLGFLLMFMLTSSNSIARIILNEKRSRTYFRIRMAPVDSKYYVLGNILANLVVVFIQVSAVIFVMTNILKIKTYVSWIELLLILMCFGLVAISISILIVAFSNDANQAGTLSTLIIIPSCLLGGCFWQIDIMPKIVKNVANFMPQKWTLEAINKLQMGSAFNEVIIQIAILLAFAAAFSTISVYKFKNNNI